MVEAQPGASYRVLSICFIKFTAIQTPDLCTQPLATIEKRVGVLTLWFVNSIYNIHASHRQKEIY